MSAIFEASQKVAPALHGTRFSKKTSKPLESEAHVQENMLPVMPGTNGGWGPNGRADMGDREDGKDRGIGKVWRI